MPPASFGTSWDVDSDGTNDFELGNGGYTAQFDDLNGGRLVAPLIALMFGDGIQKLTYGAVISGDMTAYGFHANAQAGNSITYSGDIGIDASIGDWAVGQTGFFGFKFVSGGDTHYGWGSMQITGTPVGQGFTILEAWYNDIPDAPVFAGSTVPEPAAAALGLGALALGAAGVRRWRRARTT